MHPSTYRSFSEVEELHWWFRHRRDVCRDWLGRSLTRREGVAVDVGCGTGGNLPLFSEFATTVVGYELSDQALRYCRAKGREAALVRADANDLDRTLAPLSIDLVGLLNVLYHSWIRDDDEVLAAVMRILRPGGRVLVCEAAFDGLRRRRDRFDYGARRYRLRDLKAKLERAGFEIERASYLNLIGFPLAWILARFDRWSGASDRVPGDADVDRDLALANRFAQRMAYALTGLERIWMRAGGRLPFGINLMIVARKPAPDVQVGT